MKRSFQNSLLLLASLLVVLCLVEVAIRVFGLFLEARSILALKPPGVEAKEGPLLAEAVHPFWGWAVRPGRQTDFREPGLPIFPDGEISEWSAANREANRFGFFSEIDDYREVGDDRFVIGIFGGSVAHNLANIGGATLTQALESNSPELKGRIVILNLASGGYKQPHQILVLTQMILLGVPIDVVVNVDGFNEVALGGDDARSGWHPLFPSRFHYASMLRILTGNTSEREMLLMADVVRDRSRAAQIVEFVSGSRLLHSWQAARAVLGSLVQALYIDAIQAEHQLQSQLVQRDSEELLVALPDPCFRDREGCWDLIADIWARSSLVMGQLSTGAGAQYIHVLQPTQYTPGSKVLTAAERRLAFEPDHPWSWGVRTGYPYLLLRSRDLRDQDIDFFDFSNLFRDRNETIYRDTCCHYNELGNEILAESIAELIKLP